MHAERARQGMLGLDGLHAGDHLVLLQLPPTQAQGEACARNRNQHTLLNRIA